MLIKKWRASEKGFLHSYKVSTYKIIILASLLIFMAVMVTGVVSYNSTKDTLIAKSKSKDIVFIVKSMSLEIENRIERAIETSYIIARDPFVNEWVNGEEKDELLGDKVLKNLQSLTTSYDYNSTFIAGVKTKRYYYMENQLRKATLSRDSYVLSNNNPSDDWFFSTITSPKSISLNIAHDRGLKDTFLFVNALIGNASQPVGLAGVGLSLHEISSEFQKFKVGSLSSLWLVDEKGIIQVSDSSKNRGTDFSKLIPSQIAGQILKDLPWMNEDIKVSEFTDVNGEIMDFGYHKLKGSEWISFYKIPRKESLCMIDALKSNMIFTNVLVLLFFVVLFFIISKKIANPYKQTLELNKVLENEVDERTRELTEINKKVMDSIDYAKRMQESILPSKKEVSSAFKEHFVIWRPKDTVGGDFYWIRSIGDTVILAVGDCTGHGVPGAFMTMTVNAILHHIVTAENKNNPEVILKLLNEQLKQTLNKNSHNQVTDDGLDIAICCIKNKSVISYIGAKLDLYVKRGQELKIYKAYNKGVGYNYAALTEELSNQTFKAEEGDVLIITSDGFLHQNGGEKDYPFGIKRFCNVIQGSQASSLELMKGEFEKALSEYMQDQPQRDDVVLFGFKVK